jgi:NodT family efflux transporter outer membrane factor (OMF) lipoprotein
VGNFGNTAVLSRYFPRLNGFSFLLSSVFLGGCVGTGGMAPHAQPVAPDTLATDSAIAAAAVDAQWPLDHWWQAYADPQLDRWVRLATQGNPDLAMASARVRQARAMAGVTEAAEALQVNADTLLKRHHWPNDQFYGPGELSDTSTWDNTAAIGLSYPLDLWGRERNASERSLDLAHMAAAEARQAELELQGNVVRVYIQLSLHFAQRDIVEAMLAQQQQLLDLARERLRGGIGTQFEVSQAETPLPETRRQLDSLDEDIALTGNQLAALAGQGPGFGASLRRPSLRLAADVPLPSRLPAALLGQRPDVVASRWRVAAQARGIEVAQAGFYPNVDLSASLGTLATGGGLLAFVAAGKLGYSAGPAVSLPIFDGGRLRAQLGAASAGYDLAVAQYDQSLVTALKSISDQLIRRHSLARQAQLASESVASARHTYDIAMVAYRRGLTDYLNVLNAQSLLFRQRQVEQQVQAARLGASAALITALGGGLGAAAASPPAERLAAPATPAGLALRDRVSRAR